MQKWPTVVEPLRQTPNYSTMAISGGSTDHRRRKRSSERVPRGNLSQRINAGPPCNNPNDVVEGVPNSGHNVVATAPVPPPPPPPLPPLPSPPALPVPKKRGAPKKRRTFNFSPKPPASTSINVPPPTETPTGTKNHQNTNSSKKKPPPRVVASVRTRAATANAKPTRNTTPPERFLAKPSTPTRSGPKQHWTKKKKDLLQIIGNLEASTNVYRSTLHAQWTSSVIQADRPLETPAQYSPCTEMAVEALKQKIKKFVNENPLHELTSILRTIGFESNTIRSKANNISALRNGVRVLLDYHLNSHAENEKADILGEMFFNGGLFSPNVTTDVSLKVSRAVTSTIFSAVALLRSIDSHAGALNDSAVDQYADIERQSTLLNTKRGQGMLNKRWKISHVRSIANKFTANLLTINHNQFSEYGDYVGMDIERGFRVSIDALGLKDKAQSRPIDVAITGDGAAITTSTNNAGQCCVGLKFLDEDVIDPATGEPAQNAINDDGNKVYRNCQSINTCMPVGICLQRESKGVLKGAFGHFFDWCRNAEQNGLPANGGEPAIHSINLMGTGDMSFGQKLLGTGGACKVSHHFCPWSEVHGRDNMWRTVHGINVCELCKFNEQDSCTHRNVNDDLEVTRKANALVDAILADKRLKDSDPSLLLIDILPAGEVEIFDGWEENERGDPVKKWCKVILQTTITDNTTLSLPVTEYCRHIFHSEEAPELIKNERMTLNPLAVHKFESETNIEYR